VRKRKKFQKEGAAKKERARSSKIYLISIKACRDSPIHKINKLKVHQNKL